MTGQPPPQGIPPAIGQRIREHGAALDVALAHALYQPLLAVQRRDGVAVTRDVAYGDDPRHRLDIYRSTASSAPRPVLVFLHGGGFLRGDKSNRENFGQYFAREGFLALIANYRLAPLHRWPAGAADAASACEWARAHAGDFGGDPHRVFLAGESAGAAHAAAASLVRQLQPDGGLPIAGVALISGVYDVQLEFRARRQFGVKTPDRRNEAYFGSDCARYPAMSTVDLIDVAPFPVLITYAELDLLQMQVQAGELFARLVVKHGYDPELKVIRGHNHLSQVYSVNTGDESLSGPVLEFLRR